MRIFSRYIGSIMHPERYHGHHRSSGPFFEGWYYKLVDASEQHRLAVIPGIFLGRDRRNSEAFVQVLNGMTGHATYHRYPADDFRVSPDDFDIRVGPNRFQAGCAYLDIDDSQRRIKGEVQFSDIKPWPVTLRSPGIMGWYGWIPVMECYHGVVSLDHTIDGRLVVDGATVDFSGGRGYIEKDWGEAFPKAYIWMQSNHFSAAGTSLTASIAVIPWRRSTFIGFIVGVLHTGRLYRYATYTGAVVEKLDITDDHVEWVMRDRKTRLELRAVREQGGLLHAPVRTEMHRRVNETILSSVEMRLSEVRGAGRVVVQDRGRIAALEVHGELERLAKV